MFNRMSTVVGAGVITAGVSAAMLAGAGVAIADTETGAGGESSTSESSGPVNTRTERDSPDTDSEAQGDADESSDEPDDTDIEAEPDDTDIEADPDLEESEPEPEPEVDPEPEVETESAREDDPAAGSDAPPNAGNDDAAVESPPASEPDTEAAAEAVPAEATTEEVGPPAELTTAPGSAPAPESADASAHEPTSVVTRLAVVPGSADDPTAEVSAPRQTLLSVVGTIVFNLYSFAVRVFGGPPLLPWGSTTTVRTSRLSIDCGDGYEVPANWYVPEGPTPTRLIYLQHGFLAAGPFYSYTATRLAEATHSIVVTTTLTSNFLACDGCWVGGSPMHNAVAKLFVDGNTALADSAHAAGYDPTLLDGVHDVVLTGHSAGGGLAGGAAGYMAQNGTIDRLAGVVMLDGVGFGEVLPEALAKLPDELPIYNLAGKAYYWNMNGAAGAALEMQRPGEFHGVRLIGGLHSDTMLGGNPLIQGALNLVTGWSKVENVKAAEILSAAWINDMFAGAPTSGSPYYGSAGDTLTIDTPRGTATAYVMPGPPERLTLIDELFGFFSRIVFGLNFASCVLPSDGPTAAPTGDLIEMSTPNTALSLDEGAKAGQSIGQQCMQG